MANSLDDVDNAIIAELRNDARLSMRALAKRVFLSAPATGERVRRLEERGIIRSYRAQIARPEDGAGLRAFVDVAMRSPHHARFARFVAGHEAVRACYRTSGAACYLLDVAVADRVELDALLEDIVPFGSWQLRIVVSTVADREA